MRALFLSLLLATPATAWEATVGKTCILTHDTADSHILLTFDSTKPLYTLAITRKSEPWRPTPWFAMRFEGPNEIIISTPQHALSNDGHTLHVADGGFDNVLDGLQFNTTARAFTEAQTVMVSLLGAAPEVRKFRTCAVGLHALLAKHSKTAKG